jgi:hypothetical protein
MITDRFRFTVIEVNTDRILTKDLVVKEPKIRPNLSAPSTMEFKIDQNQQFLSSRGITWKINGQLVVCELEIDYVQYVWAWGLVSDAKVDQASGDMEIQVTGMLGYLNNRPYLENFNPIAVDPFEIVSRVVAHLGSFSNANLGISVVPASSGTQMLPGYSYDGNILNFDFFAVFYRASDMNDCADIVNGLARDIPFDMIEEAEWNEDKTVLNKQFRLGYPQGGFQQNSLTFRLGVNVIKAEVMEPPDIQQATDVIVRGWLPGRVMSAELSNADPTIYRTTILEEDAQIDSTERAAAQAKRRLTRRNIPISFKSMTIDPNHPDAPLGSFNVGDSVYCYAPNYPWYGDIEGWHRVTYIDLDQDKNQAEVGLKVEGAWQYDPIEYNPDLDGSQPAADANRLANGYFANNLGGWTSNQGQWIRTTLETYQTQYNLNSGAVRIDCDDHGEQLESHVAGCVAGEDLRLQCVIRYDGVTVADGAAPTFQLLGVTSYNGDLSVGETFVIDEIIGTPGSSGWVPLKMDHWTVPDGINEIHFIFNVTANVTGGVAFWTYARIVPGNSPLVPT